MIRATAGDFRYWNKWVEHSEARTRKMKFSLAQPSLNPTYDPQYALDASFEFLRLIFERYSRGDTISSLVPHFDGVIELWELSNQLSQQICEENALTSCRDWTFDLINLNHYNWCFWLVGLAITLEISEEKWSRLLVLIDATGRDQLLDLVIATRQLGRTIHSELLHTKPYSRLLYAVEDRNGGQPKLLLEFVDNWYAELARKGKSELWWYAYGDPIKNPLTTGSYFGRWCVEAVVVAKVFHIDDSLCLGHQYYPGDLLRPHEPSTHRPRPVPQRVFSTNFLAPRLDSIKNKALYSMVHQGVFLIFGCLALQRGC